MSEPTACTLTPADPDLPSSPSWCENCDLLVGLDGLHVRAVVRDEDGLTVTVESPPAPNPVAATNRLADARSTACCASPAHAGC